MKVFILTRVSAQTTYDGATDRPSVNVDTFLSVVEAQLAMYESLETEASDASDADYTIDRKEICPTGAILCYSNYSSSEILWEITEHDVPVSCSGHFAECEKKLIALVEKYGKVDEPLSKELRVKRLVLPTSHNFICCGGWLGEESETVDALCVVDNVLYVETETCSRATEEFPSDDLEHLCEEIEDNLDYIRYNQEYFQPELKNTQDVPAELHSFQVFATEEDAKEWMSAHGYGTEEYKVFRYTGEDIEEPTVLDKNGNVLFNPDFPL